MDRRTWGEGHDERPRVAAVTGASAGVGAAVATAFGALGWTVAVGARREDRLRETAAAVEAAGGTAVAHRLDVTDPASVDAFFDAVEERVGPARVLVNNAGVGYLGAIAETSVDRLRAVVDTNLLGSLYCSRRALAAMLSHPPADGEGQGDVVFVSSDSVVKAYPHMIPYGATKAAIEYVANGLDLELAGTGVRVATVRLGPTVSEFNTTWDDEDMIAFMKAWERLGIKEDFNYVPAETVAHAVVAAVTAPRGAKVNMVVVRPEATLDQDERTRWATAATQGRDRRP